MSETTDATATAASATENEGTTDATTETTGSAAYTPPATQAELDRIISDRVARTKNQFKDYNDLKSKAAQFDQLQQANQTEAERQAQELTRWQTEAETWRKAAVGNRIEALASTDFADPSDAISALAGNDYLDAGGQIDEPRILADLAEVLDRKPHWRRPGATTPTGPRAPAPNLAQGSGGAAVLNPAEEFAALLRGGFK